MSVRNRFSWDFLGKYMVCMLVQGVVFFLLTLAIQLRVWTKLPNCLKWRRKKGKDKEDKDEEDEEDADVGRERERVLAKGEEGAEEEDVLLIKGLTKR